MQYFLYHHKLHLVLQKLNRHPLPVAAVLFSLIISSYRASPVATGDPTISQSGIWRIRTNTHVLRIVDRYSCRSCGIQKQSSLTALQSYRLAHYHHFQHQRCRQRRLVLLIAPLLSNLTNTSPLALSKVNI